MAPVDPADIDIATLAWLTGSAANRYLLDATKTLGHPGVRISHGYVLQHLIDGQPTVTELAKGMGVTQQRASTQVRELEQLGYVTRRPDDTDSRVRRVCLTPHGNALIADSRHAREELNAELARIVGEDRLRATAETLAHLLESVGGAAQVRRRAAPAPEE
ncbi:MarR family winged helix-turn-helix transcriptional regulator [Demequina sp.]|uniref:MarR family winged helix-turn-helix transcriptional regulator n=1 Tax=Demequina sp. TaxID=2050685 RepID=UPI0025BF4261|nr:MarR family winged helix-turn-helix transcriptional regulator [Demequina sp.]